MVDAVKSARIEPETGKLSYVYDSTVQQEAPQTTASPSTTVVPTSVSGGFTAYLPIAGGTMTGPLILVGPPDSANEAATKAYVDSLLGGGGGGGGDYVLRAGDTMTGLLTLSGAPTANLHAATKLYVDQSIAAIPLPFVLKAGDTMTGLLTLSGAPTANLHAATKKYVDDKFASVDLSSLVLKAGDTMTGLLTLSGAPTTDLHAATKKYVDDQIAAIPSSSPPPLSFVLFIDGKPTADQNVLTFRVPENFTFSANFGGSYAVAEIAATAEAVFTVKKNGTNIGTVTFAAAGTAGVYSGSSVAFATGDTFNVTAPTVPDSTLCNIGFTFRGTRS